MIQSANAGRHRRAMNDMRRCVVDSRIWRALAFSDIRGKYRLSTLGSLWISLSTGVTAVTIGLIYGQFFGVDMESYLPYFVGGMITWTWIAAVLNEATTALISAAPLIKASNLPLGFHILRIIQRNFIILLHNLMILGLVWLWARWQVGPEAALSVLGLVLVYIFLVGAAAIIAMVCVRYRDIPPMVAAATQFLFFASPILWYPEKLKVGATVLALNPMASLIAVVRDPLLGRAVEAATWGRAVAVAVATLALGVYLYTRYRDRVAYWV